jgi:hypothetical protein
VVKVQNTNHIVITLVIEMKNQLILLLLIFLIYSCEEKQDSSIESKEEITIGVMSPEDAPAVEFDYEDEEAQFWLDNNSAIDSIGCVNVKYLKCQRAIDEWIYFKSGKNEVTDFDIADEAAKQIYKLVFKDSKLNYWCKFNLIKQASFYRHIAYTLHPMVGKDIKEGNLEFVNLNFIHILNGTPVNFPQFWINYLEAHPYQSNVGIIPIN